MNEAQAGGLIDRYWILNYIIIPTAIIISFYCLLSLIGLYISCPYIEDVSSCFPYNLPKWIKIAMPLVTLIIIPILLYLIRGTKRQ